ncbi:MAG TPA: AAA family ATPase [Armatimonadota bacterium]|nr:AAA family ATPase [Armatimonadota bacterium]
MGWRLDEFNIDRFRGLQNVRLTGLGRINLLVGPNDSGKTSILEALSVFANPLDDYNLVSLAVDRDRGVVPFFQPLPESLKWLFPQCAAIDGTEHYSGEIRMSASGSYRVSEMSAVYRELVGVFASALNGDTESPDRETDRRVKGFDEDPVRRGAEIDLKVKYHPGPDLPTVSDAHSFTFRVWEPESFETARKPSAFSLRSELLAPFSHRSHSLSSRFSYALEHGIQRSVIDLMRQIDPQIRDIEILSGRFDRAVLHVKHELSGLVPISMFGEGVRRALSIALTVPGVEGGILLIDEIDAAIHTSALVNLFQFIVNACRQYNVQLFATTHSLEAVDALMESAAGSDEFVFFRLPTMGESATLVRLDREKVRILREDLGQEVR